MKAVKKEHPFWSMDVVCSCCGSALNEVVAKDLYRCTDYHTGELVELSVECPFCKQRTDIDPTCVPCYVLKHKSVYRDNK